MDAADLGGAIEPGPRRRLAVVAGRHRGAAWRRRCPCDRGISWSAARTLAASDRRSDGPVDRGHGVGWWDAGPAHARHPAGVALAADRRRTGRTGSPHG